MIQVAIYDMQTGEIRRRILCPAEMVDIQVQDGEEFYLNCPAEATHILAGDPCTVVPEISLDELKTRALERIAFARWRAETGGIDLAGSRIDTDREAQTQLAGALVAFRSGFVVSSAWKTAGQWVPVTLETMEVISAAVSAHVQACFSRERELASTIAAAATPEEVAAVEW